MYFLRNNMSREIKFRAFMTIKVEHCPRCYYDRRIQVNCEVCGDTRHIVTTEGLIPLSEVEKLIVEEIVTAQLEGTPTSRLTSLIMKLKESKQKE